jgi:hypothetical protein
MFSLRSQVQRHECLDFALRLDVCGSRAAAVNFDQKQEFTGGRMALTEGVLLGNCSTLRKERAIRRANGAILPVREISLHSHWILQRG